MRHAIPLPPNRLAGPLALILALAVCPAVAGDVVSFGARSHLVRVPVTVTDRHGMTLTDLEVSHFQVFDNAEERPVLSLSREEAPASVSILLDLSGSMASKLNEAKSAVVAITDALGADDRVALSTFADRPELVAGFGAPPALAEKLWTLSAGGSTALIDAVYTGLNRLRAIEGRRRAMVVISDGADNHSRYSSRELFALAIESDVQIYAISIEDNNLSRTDPRGVLLLERLAAETGGLHLTVRHRGALTETARKLARAVKDVYVLAYQPPASTGSGKWRRVRVKIDPVVGRSARVNAKSGYYEP